MYKVIRAFFHSMDGLKAVWKSEFAFRLEVFISIILCPVPPLLSTSLPEKGVMYAALLTVMMVEVINSAIEATVDLATKDIHPLAKKAKDAGSLAVLFAVIIFFFVWGGIILPKLL